IRADVWPFSRPAAQSAACATDACRQNTHQPAPANGPRRSRMHPHDPVSPTILPGRSNAPVKSAKPERQSFRLTRKRKDEPAAAPSPQPVAPPPPPPAPVLGKFAPVAAGPGAALAHAADHTSGLERLAVHAAENPIDA